MKTNQNTAFWMKGIALWWIIWVFLDYWFKHPLYAQSLADFQLAIPITHLIVAGLGFVFIRKFLKSRPNWLTLILTFAVLLWSSMLVSLFCYADFSSSAVSILHFIVRTTGFLLFLVLFFLSAILLSKIVFGRLIKIKGTLPLVVHIALGLSYFMFIILALLALNVFGMISVSILIIFPLILRAGQFKSFVTQTLTQPFDRSYNTLALVSLMMILIMNSVTFGYTLTPLPTGFDAMNYYVNLPKLLNETGHLISGFQPYNWSLLQAAGQAVTGSVEMVLILSWVGLVLVQVTTYDVGRRVLKISSDWVLFGIMLFTFMPAVTTQASQELKVDLGLTFFLLAMVLVGALLLNAMRSAGSSREVRWLAILLGVLGGVALGIKLTAVIALFALVALIWQQRFGMMAFFGIFFICLALVFFAQLDAKAGLRVYHASVSWLQYVSLIVGLALFIYSIRLKRKEALQAIYTTTIIGVITVLFFSPWIIKNYSEIKNPSFIELLNGKKAGPSFNLKKIDRRYQKEQNRK